tara:strand:- start:4847 stop:5365 length:519 start_codon:yes stop_codon:yes gene_type:complete
MRPIHEIIIHATATPANWRAGEPTSAKVAEVRRWHVVDRKWSDVGYHYLIDRDGTVATGRPLETVGAHVQGHNTGSVGVALFGGRGGVADGMFADNYTPEQDKALRGLIGRLKAVYPITQISGHNEYANKACPCFKAMEWYRAPMMPQAAPLAGPSPFAAFLALLAKIFGGK